MILRLVTGVIPSKFANNPSCRLPSRRRQRFLVTREENDVDQGSLNRESSSCSVNIRAMETDGSRMKCA